MKKLKILFPFLCVVFLFASCTEGSQNSETFNIEEQGELMQQDPLVRDYYEAMSYAFSISSQDLGILRLNEYRNIIEQENTSECNVNVEAFEGNKGFERLAEANCIVSKLNEKFRTKYPNFMKMKKSDRLSITRPIIESLPTNTDIEKMNQRLEEYNNHFSDDEKNLHKEEAERILEIEIPEANANN